MSLLDRAVSQLLKLPRATSAYTIERDLAVPMRDGVRLLADHYVPSGTPRGTLLVRSPYGRAGAFALVYARPYAARGYHVVVQSCRATFGSGGTVNAFAGEAEDGADTVDWLRAQRWYTGSFATLGVSYLGLNQWALLTDPPADMKAAVIVSGPHDTHDLLYGSGALALQSVAGWSTAILHQEDRGPVMGVLAGPLLERKTLPVLNGLPLRDAAHSVYGTKAPWLDAWLEHPDGDDPFWAASSYGEALDRAAVPVLLYSGWHDLILEQTLEQYAALAARGVDVALVVGPWNHAEMLAKASGLTARETLGWLSEHLVGDGKRLETAPVRIFVTGADEWRDLASWPPAASEQIYYLRDAGGLSAEAGSGAAAAFTYDPLDPTPTVGGMSNARTAGRADNRALERRPDVVTFTSAVLERDVEVMGTPVLTLAHRSDNPHCDVFVRLCEVDAKGRSWNLCERFVRLTAAGEAPLRLELSPVAHRFARGTRVRVQVSGGSHPQHDRNLGTGESPAEGSQTRPSRRSISTADGASWLVLPVTHSG